VRPRSFGKDKQLSNLHNMARNLCRYDNSTIALIPLHDRSSRSTKSKRVQDYSSAGNRQDILTGTFSLEHDEVTHLTGT
jgi:hypothetical protein